MMSVPAWKRLGLKLKGPGAPEAPAPASIHTSSAPHKRKFDLFSNPSTPARPANATSKKARIDTPQSKSVSFTADTDTTPRTNISVATPVKPKKAKKPKAPKVPGAKKPVVKQVTSDITPSLEYLRLWKTARAAWKFNKNHQTLLAKYLYQRTMVPAADAVVFYKYIRDMAGYARERLLTSAREVVRADMESVTGEVATLGVPIEAPTAGQMSANARYHVRLAEVAKTMDANKVVDEKMVEDETEDKSMVKRLIRRVRAEAVIAALESSAGNEKVLEVRKRAEEAAVAKQKEPTSEPVVEKEEKEEETPAVESVKVNGKKTRARKKRVMADSDLSSSESDSDSSDSDSN